MLSVAEARARMLAALAPLAAEEVALEAAYDRVLAAPVHARRDQPPFDASAMDGYALASAADARDFAIVGESAAGRAFARGLGDGEAIRISTGAPMPAGADGVLIQEDAHVEGARLRNAKVARGRHVRPRGGDFRAGAMLLEAGRRLDPIAVALAATAGAATLSVTRRPRITILAGGDELVSPGDAATADQIYESGSFALVGLARRWGGEARRGQRWPDDEAAILEHARAALGACDLLVIVGGASVGPHDHARAALQRAGLDLLVTKVAVRPGKPTWFGVAGSTPVLGLPGNPASALVCAVLFLRPAIAHLLGADAAASTAPTRATLAQPLSANGDRETYLRASLDGTGRLHAFADQDSSLLSVFAQSNALILRPPHAPAAPEGACVPYLPL